ALGEPARTPLSAPAQSGSSLEGIVLAVVSEKTGYPIEMLDPDMDIEADLGIDSIKRVEIIAAIEERAPHSTTIRPENMGSLRTLRQIMDFMGASAMHETVTTAVNTAGVSAQTAAAPPVCSDAEPNIALMADELLAVVSQ